MCNTVVVDEESLIKINIIIHMLCVVLVKHSYVSVQVALVEDAVDALGGSDVAYAVTFYAVAVADAHVGHRLMVNHLNVVFNVNLVFQGAKSLQSGFDFHLFEEHTSTRVKSIYSLWRYEGQFYFFIKHHFHPLLSETDMKSDALRNFCKFNHHPVSHANLSNDVFQKSIRVLTLRSMSLR